jgi:hypothetical protein
MQKVTIDYVCRNPFDTNNPQILVASYRAMYGDRAFEVAQQDFDEGALSDDMAKAVLPLLFEKSK